MAGEHLDPGAVSPADAAVVLAALNQVATAEELAALVELPDELDVGVRVAARILARRGELGGFTSLEQVAAVPLVGPERFTEIVVALTGRRPPQRASDVERQVEVLRGEVARLAALVGPAPEVALRAPLGPWLGLPVAVDVRFPAEPPRELVVVCRHGRLRSASRGEVEEGAAVRVVTGHDRAAEVSWHPEAAPPLGHRHLAALATALPELGDAATPAAAAAVLDGLAARYDQEAHVAFREAVDGLAGAQGQLDPSAEDAWPLQQVVVWAQPLAAGDALGASAGGHVGVGVLVLRDWIGALSQALAQRLRRTSRLDSQLETEAGRGLAAGDLGAAVQRRVGSYVARRHGALGREAARAVADEATQRLLSGRVAALPLADRERLVPLLTGTARAVLTGSTELLEVVESTGTAVRRDAGTRVDLTELLDRVDEISVGVDTRVADVEARLERKADLRHLDDLFGRVRTIEDRLGR